MKKFLSILVFTAAALSSCIYPYDTDLKGVKDTIVVLEGEILVGGVSTMRISSVNSFSESIFHHEVRGMATVEDDQGNIYSSNSKVPRSLVSIPMEDAPSDRKYRFRVTVDGTAYYSDWLDPLEPPVIEEVKAGLSADSTRVEITTTLDGGVDASGYIGITYDETWEFHADYMCRYELDTLKWRINERFLDYPNYWCWRSNSLIGMILVDYTEIDGNRVVSYPVQAFPRYNNRNHRKYSIEVHAVTLSNEAYKYIKNLNDNTNTSGTLFSPNPGEMPSNLYCLTNPDKSVMGYVTASKVASQRIFMDSQYHTPTSPPEGYLFISEDYKHDYEFGYYPVDFMSLPRGEEGAYISGIYWGPMRCIDCIAAGGTKEKPDFWQ